MSLKNQTSADPGWIALVLAAAIITAAIVGCAMGCNGWLMAAAIVALFVVAVLTNLGDLFCCLRIRSI